MTTPPTDPSDPSFSYETSPALYLFTSLTSGSSHIITATSRLETILKANRVPFRAVDCATDEKARRIWGRRSGGKKLPGLVREAMVLADLEIVEEWNEFGEIKQNLGTVAAAKPVAATKEGKENTAPTSTATGEHIKEPAKQDDAAIPLRERLADPTSPPPDAQQSHQSALAAEAAAAAAVPLRNKAPRAILDQTKIRPLPDEVQIPTSTSPTASTSRDSRPSGTIPEPTITNSASHTTQPPPNTSPSTTTSAPLVSPTEDTTAHLLTTSTESSAREWTEKNGDGKEEKGSGEGSEERRMDKRDGKAEEGEEEAGDQGDGAKELKNEEASSRGERTVLGGEGTGAAANGDAAGISVGD